MLAGLMDFVRAGDEVVARLLLPTALWLLISGLDDLLVTAVALWGRLRGKLPAPPSPEQLEATEELPIAIIVPCWREHQVIARMVEHNLSAIRYCRFHFFIGAYPNDAPTVAVIRSLEEKYANVHLALTPHDGPTSKADCLNWIYQRIIEYERQNSQRFELIVMHDAEDLIHPQSFRWMNFYARQYAMVQTPVLAWPTPWKQFTHGVYCDEFAEYQMQDMQVRQLMGSFIPSCGVGTAFRRDALERLAEENFNRIFEPVCLTEDYENGLRLRLLGVRQAFLPLCEEEGSWVATREFFPQSFDRAVKQRSRWVTGISLQTWERHGWRGSLAVRYWLWRDRKSLVGAPISLLTNLLFCWGVTSFLLSAAARQAWQLAITAAHSPLLYIAPFTLSLQAARTWVRMRCVSRIYGWKFAAWVPLRVFWGNVMNALAVFRALFTFARAKWRAEPLRWVKTDHSYPNQLALRGEKRALEEVLVGSGYVTEEQLTTARQSRPSGCSIGEHLVRLGWLTSDQLYEALSLAENLPLADVEEGVDPAVARSLPERVVQRWKVLPFRVEYGSILVASPELPNEEAADEVRRFTGLEVRFHLITPERFDELSEKLL